jgi:transketolase
LANNFNPEVDDLIISKGHAALALYSVLHEFSIIEFEQLKEFKEEDSHIGIHVTNGLGPFSRLSTGSLGHGIGFGAGLALGKKLKNLEGNVYVIVGDGELNEGSNFEALQIASTLNLHNLTVIVDHNQVQSVANYSEVAGGVEIKQKFLAFGWDVKEIGLTKQINTFDFEMCSTNNAPKCLIYFSSIHPILPEIQNQVLWHYRRPESTDVEKAFEVLDSFNFAPDYVDWFRKL